jgi:hypothetical protein
MSSNFKPLTTGANASATNSSGRATGQRDLKGQFHPVGVSGDNLRPTTNVGAHASHLTHGPAGGSTHAVAMEPAPRISTAITRLIRDGDRITHIEVQCGCGEIITLECGYTAAGE